MSFNSVIESVTHYAVETLNEVCYWLDYLRITMNQLCVGLEPWQVVAYTLGFVCFAIWLHSLLRSDQPLRKRVPKKFYKFVRSLPPVRRRIEEEISRTRHELAKIIHKRDPRREFYTRLPETGLSREGLLEEVDFYKNMDPDVWPTNRRSGIIFEGDDELTDISGEVFKKFAWTNPLHPDLFPSVRKMEAEVVRMCCSMYHGNDSSCGTMTSGGTESVILACLAYRNRAYALGISAPEMVIPVTAHAAYDKAGEFLRIQVNHVPICLKTGMVDLNKMQRAITSNTIMLVGSAPSFPHGIVDPLDEISRLGKRYNIPVHVDASFGGFLQPFMHELGYSTQPFDFRLSGVTSISCDTHKYGNAVKGTSVILYRSPTFVRYQYFCQPDWPGGMYASSTLASSRSGANIAMTWASMLYFGHAGYVQRTKDIINAARLFKDGLKEIQGLELIGDAQGCIVAFKSNLFDIYKLIDRMNVKGYCLIALQNPPGAHVAITRPITRGNAIDLLLKDIADISLDLIQEQSDPDVRGTTVLYGVSKKTGDRSLVQEFAYAFLDSCYETTVPSME